MLVGKDQIYCLKNKTMPPNFDFTGFCVVHEYIRYLFFEKQ